MRLIALACVAGLAASANAQNILSSNVGLGGGGNGGYNGGNDSPALWDQSGFDVNLGAPVDQEFGDFASFSTYDVDDFTTGGQIWNVDTVHTYFTKGFGGWNNSITQGSLSLFSKSGSLPGAGDVPPEYKVAITLIDGGNYWEVVADTSGIAELQGINGDFWIGLTPRADFGVYGQEFHAQVGAVVGDQSAFRNPGGGFGLGTGWMGCDVLTGARQDMGFKLDGTVVPAPGAAALLGLGGLLAGRRRR
jgi:MYXO-CTERM domain-containing protein